MDQVTEKLAPLRKKLDKYPQLQELENKAGVPKEILVCGAGAFLALIMVLGFGVSSLSSLVGFMYPAYKSLKAIEAKTKGDDVQWLVYWVIFAFFSILETFVDILLYWIPFYYAFKLAFLLWAMLPQTKGAKFLYDSFLKDLLKKNESRIDAALNEAKNAASNITESAQDAAASAVDDKKDS
mmetsp:Transcript_13688/g.17849  ORF Transcript_13688/g.17849 Transcript_13688/m.17849 type:complete len:182 (+) Transcript_13688:160-705(+)|eukprot:CAMPEP_0198136922 /NCGR_PEP_ID=MMETSP1443-20131203/470_1 /TAXON_ID=186043 /ORGANISM="Entomoneis sp., Strain CCMP2396" /LENGTH=181 /DNA_ID=CAMNT_0043798219 /DNA_START=128 /DNA_END=673 /DNA_ORIENTATION=-